MRTTEVVTQLFSLVRSCFMQFNARFVIFHIAFMVRYSLTEILHRKNSRAWGLE